MYTVLFKHIQRYINLSPDEESFMARYLHLKPINKKAYLLTEGQIAKNNYFVLSGCLRMYFVKENGQEQITQFGLENWWLTDYLSYDLQQPSGFYIQAIEHSQIAVLSKSNQEILLKHLPSLERYFRIILQKNVAAAQMRMRYLHDLSGTDQYHHFATAFPDFVQRVPQYMLASYLGFTPEFLSKIKVKK